MATTAPVFEAPIQTNVRSAFAQSRGRLWSAAPGNIFAEFERCDLL